jgi:hypothetical protein
MRLANYQQRQRASIAMGCKGLYRGCRTLKRRKKTAKSIKKFENTARPHVIHRLLAGHPLANAYTEITAAGMRNSQKPGPDWPGSGSHAKSGQRAGITAAPEGWNRVRKGSRKVPKASRARRAKPSGETGEPGEAGGTARTRRGANRSTDAGRRYQASQNNWGFRSPGRYRLIREMCSHSLSIN